MPSLGTRVLVVGHWDLTSPDLSGGLRAATDVVTEGSGFGSPTDATQDALGALARGIRSTRERMTGKREAAATSDSGDLTLEVVPFGPARAAELAASLAAQSGDPSGGGPTEGFSQPTLLISDPRGAASSRGLGEAIRAAALGGPTTLIIEGGHSSHHDWGAGLLTGLAGAGLTGADLTDPGPTGFEGSSLDEDSSEEQWLAALEDAQAFLDSTGVSPVFASQTARPLIGAGSPAQLTPTLQPRATELHGPQALAPSLGSSSTPGFGSLTFSSTALPAGPLVGQRVQAALVRHFRNHGGVTDPTRMSGSGASGGAAAVLTALGARLRPSFNVLEELVDLERRIAESDLVVALEPHLDVPELSDLGLTNITALAEKNAKPVVAVGVRSSLSSPERAELGLHATTLLASDLVGKDAFEDAGRRVAQTWLRAI